MIEIKRENASDLSDQLYETISTAPKVKDTRWLNIRELEFFVGNKRYVIEWYWNQSYLYFEDKSMFLFQKVKVSGTWPNKYKENLQFTQNGETIAVIPLVPYEQ